MAYSGVPALHATDATLALLPRGGDESGLTIMASGQRIVDQKWHAGTASHHPRVRSC
jgi:hypothetical protein